MRKVHYILLAIVAVNMAACGAPQKQFRGNENSPYTNVERLNVNQDELLRLPYPVYQERMARLREIKQLQDGIIDTNARAAESEKGWVSDENSVGPYFQSGAGRGGGGYKEPTIASEAARTLRQETSSVLRNTMSSAGNELSNEARTLIRGIFD